MSPHHVLLEAVPLLAQRTNWHSLGDRFSGDHLRFQTEDMVWAGVLVAFFVSLVGLLKWLAYCEKVNRDRPKPKRLFNELCDAHGLNHEQRASLRELASAKGLSHPVELFVRPELLRDAGGGLSRLHDRLFGVGSSETS